ncbi:MAG: hypothetical protein QM668_02985 [Agriterribacter sp.]
MEIKPPFVFQADAEIVNDVYENHPNYLIEYNENAVKEYCIVYFASNDLYYPNNEIAFSESVIKKNRFEWYGNRINYGYKHIFLRDIKKQWYLTGINATLNCPAALFDFLREETMGYKTIFLGSSAGGFISVILGQLINAERIYTFNGQFEILSLLNESNAEMIDPILFRNKNNEVLLPYYNAANFITNPSTVYYFHSNKSTWDIEQNELVKQIPVNRISFITSNHGVPFLKSNLPVVLNLSLGQLKELSGKTMHPLFFSLKLVGLLKTLEGLKSIVQFALNKVYIKTIQKWKKKNQ